jgi:hypothetical protein
MKGETGRADIGLSPDFYRNFYRTGRNRSAIHSTVQHGASGKPCSEGARWTSADPRGLPESKFKSPLAHREIGLGPWLIMDHRASDRCGGGLA